MSKQADYTASPKSLSKLLGLIAASLSISLSCAAKDLNTEVTCIESSTPPGSRTYLVNGSWVVYEGSLIRNLIDIGRKLGMEPVRFKLGHDVHMMRRLISADESAESVAQIINASINGAKITVKDNAFWVEGTEVTSSIKKESVPSEKISRCNDIVHQIHEAPLHEVLLELGLKAGWEMDVSSLSTLQRSMLVETQVLVGASYFDILAKLISSLPLEVSIHD